MVKIRKVSRNLPAGAFLTLADEDFISDNESIQDGEDEVNVQL
jgi:hypothetical protein